MASKVRGPGNPRPTGRGGGRASAALPLLDDVPTSPASRRLASARTALAPKCKLIFSQALRMQSEGMTLTWPSVDFTQKSVTVEDHFAKNGETRTVPLNSVALETIKRLK